MKRHGAMNRIFRLVWSQVSQAWVAVPEVSRGRGKSTRSKLISVAMLSLLGGLNAQAAPTGAQVTAGAGSVTQTGSTTTITQSSPNLSLNWKTFNIAPTETVNFVQPSATAIAVNRIYDTNGSQILGRLNANGQVFLINPNGVLFGAGAQVNVGGLVASTLDLSDASLNSNSRSFSGTGTGSIVNLGTLNATGSAGTGGFVALLGNSVSNQGSISAPLGTVALGAGSAATLTFQNNSLVKLQIDQSVLNNLTDNGGVIHASGGLVLMSAGAKDALLASVVNNTGVIEARSVTNHAGSIVLLGGMAAGTVNVAGTLDASAPNGGNGGLIETSAAKVKIASATNITTAAPQGKVGTWLIDPNDFTVAASGGDISGATLSANLASSSVVLQSNSGQAAGAGNLNVNDAVSWSANTALTLTATNNVNVNANVSATGNSAGLLINPNTTNGGVAASGTGQFNLNNGAAITLSGATPSLAIAGTAYTVINSLGAAGSSTASDLQGMKGDLTLHYALGSNIDASATASWNAGAGFSPVGYTSAGATTFTGIFDGLGHTISNLTINRQGAADVGLFGAAANYAEIRNIGLLGGSVVGGAGTGGLLGTAVTASISNSYNTGTVSGAAGTGGLAGVITTGGISSSYTTGTVSGAAGTGGLIGVLTTGSISDSYNSANVTGNAGTGGLVGVLTTGNVSGSYTTGNVTGAAGTGGVSGVMTTGSISDSYTTGNVVGAAGTGGLAGGITTGTVSSSFTTGTVVGAAGTSSLAGTSPAGSISNSFAVSAGQTIDFAALSTSGKWMLSASGMPILKSLVKSFTITAQDATKAYDSLGFLGGNGVSYSDPYQSYLTGTVSYSGTSQNARNAGSYVITPGGLSSTNSQYVVTYVSGTLTINPRALTVTATGLNKVYDGTTTASVALSDNRIAGDVLSLSLAPSTTGSATSGSFISMTDSNGVITQSVTGTSGANFADKNVALGKTVFVVGIQVQGQDAGNYVANTTALSTASITPKALTVVAVGQNKVYDGSTTDLLNLSSSGIVKGDNLLLNGNGAFADANVGTAKAVAVKGIYATGGDAKNYTLNNTSASASANITPKSITVTASGTDKVYDGNTSDVVSLSSSGVLTQDSSNVLFTGASAFTNKNAGVGKVVAVSNISASGSQSGNYKVTNSSATAYATVTAKNLTVAASGSNKTYDGSTTDSVILTSNGVVSGDTVNFASSSAVFNDKNVGSAKTVTVSGISLSGTDAKNYTNNASASSTATITAKGLTVVAVGQNKVYDGNTTDLVSLSSTGVVKGDNLLLNGNGAFADANAGTAKTVNVTGISLAGNDAGNYSLNSTVASTTANIAQKVITVQALGADKTYDGNTSDVVSLSSTGVLAQDLSNVQFNAASAFTNKNVGVGKAVVVNNISASGSQSANYKVSNSSATAYATVTAKTLVVNATGSDKVYDGTTKDVVSLSSNGVVSGDTVNFASTNAVFTDKNVANDKSVTVSGISLSGKDAGNYAYNASALTTANITPKSIAVTATGGSMVYDATLNAAVSLASSGLVKGDSVNFTSAAALMDNKNVGVGKLVTVSGISALGSDALNYQLSNTSATAKATVTPRLITVVATGNDKTFDGTTTDTVSLQSLGVIAGDSLSFTSTSAKFANSAVGVNKVVTVSGVRDLGADAANYTVVNQTVTTVATITPKQ